jgi:hypothetical protein
VNLSGFTTLVSIGEWAFCSTALAAVDLSGCGALETIGSYAFAYNGTLTSLGAGSGYTMNVAGCTSLQSIGAGAFFNCTALSSVDLSSCTSLTVMGKEVFHLVQPLSIVLPPSITSLGVGDNYIYSSTYSFVSGGNLTILAPTPPVLGMLSSGDANVLVSVSAIYVPAGSVEAYKAAPGWEYSASKIQAIP